MSIRLLSNITDTAVITGTIGGYLADVLPTWAAAVVFIYGLTRIYEWARVAVWNRPPR